jgi:hypothetical protein
MKPLLTIALAALTACGGLENAPLRTGTVHGQLMGIDAEARVGVLGHEELTATPGPDGRFVLEGVPTGQVELLVVINALQAQRLSVNVEGASILDVGTVAARPAGRIEIAVLSLGGHRLTGGTVSVVGTPFTSPIRPPENEASLVVPAGCYEIRVAVPGLGTALTSGCVEESFQLEKRVVLESPDGSFGREGCSVTGCRAGLSCGADRSCR